MNDVFLCITIVCTYTCRLLKLAHLRLLPHFWWLSLVCTGLLASGQWSCHLHCRLRWWSVGGWSICTCAWEQYISKRLRLNRGFPKPTHFWEVPLIVLNFWYDLALITKRLSWKFELDSTFSFRDLHTQNSSFPYILIARTQSGPNHHLNIQESFKLEACISNGWNMV